MGYTTIFEGQIAIDPPLNPEEISYLKAFSSSRRMDRISGPYSIRPEKGSFAGKGDPDILDYNKKPKGQPGLWCQWVPTDDGAFLEWDGGEKFYEADKWMSYLINHFLRPDPCAKILEPAQFAFLQGHALQGTINALGETPADDVWQLRVNGLKTFIRTGSWPKPLLNQWEKMSADGDYPDDGETLALIPTIKKWSKWAKVPAFTEGIEKIWASAKEASQIEKAISKPKKTAPKRRL